MKRKEAMVKLFRTLQHPGGLMKRLACYLLFIGCGMASFPSVADMTVTVKGTVVYAPCTVNETNATIEVDFGSVQSTAVASSVPLDIPYTLVCEDEYPTQLNMWMEGTVSSFDSVALAMTNRTDLGIKITQDGKPLVIGQKYMIDPQRQPKLQAVLVADPTTTVTTGAFRSTATLFVEVP